ncbi:MAG: Eco57I restriction-modification methylase domain-containing protein, partial [Promethearchaeota archaeon]
MKWIENNPIGQIFTPHHIAEFMVKNSLKFIKNLGKSIHEITVLEPSAGKGIFLKYLIQNNFKNITAYEIDEKLKNSLLQKYPDVNFRFMNVLSSDLNEKFDLIIGNPPYLGQNYNAEVFQEYIKKFPICAKYFVGNMDLFYFFIHIGIEKLNPGGILSFITTNYWVTKSKKTGIKLLKPHILDECYILQYIDLSNLALFKQATGQDNCIFLLQKKTKKEKECKTDKKIEIIQIGKRNNLALSNNAFNQSIFENLIHNKNSIYIKKYYSALTNNNLKRDGSWNLIYPEQVKELVEKIEKFCFLNGKVSLLNDFFIIRNGLILIKDEYFILNEGINLKIENNDFLIKINKNFFKLNEHEKSRLKKVYKSRSILPYGYKKEDFSGYIIYFNRSECNLKDIDKSNRLFEKKYPTLMAYLRQYEKELREILINAKENPEDFYFPRRGAYIHILDQENKDTLIDLEPFYDHHKKIFFKYISSENLFGFTEKPYYATSDTYFLWPKSIVKDIDYHFILAYLNSKIVAFLFKAKNIKI